MERINCVVNGGNGHKNDVLWKIVILSLKFCMYTLGGNPGADLCIWLYVMYF